MQELLTYAEQTERLAADEPGLALELDETNVSNPPTDAELDSIFGTPANLPPGFVAIINDNGAGSNEYLVWADGTNWFHVAGTKAT